MDGRIEKVAEAGCFAKPCGRRPKFDGFSAERLHDNHYVSVELDRILMFAGHLPATVLTSNLRDAQDCIVRDAQ